MKQESGIQTDRPKPVEVLRTTNINNKEFSLIGHGPRATLEFLRDTRERFALAGAMPSEFGRFQLDHPSGPKQNVEQTEIKATGSGRSTLVRIEKDDQGRPVKLKDQFGNWKSDDGGKTWKTGKPQFRVRRGESSIDSEGNYSFDNTDYGVKSIYRKDGNSVREMTSTDGGKFSVTKDAKGVPIEFSTPQGTYKGDGKNWTNVKTGETLNGSVSLTDYGEFKFRPEKGDTKDSVREARTTQLEQSLALQKQISEKYGVTFGKPGEKRVETEDGKEHTYIAGMPTAGELKVLQDVLKKTDHEDYRGMKVWFIRPDENKADYWGHYGNEDETSDKPHRCGGDCSHTKPRKDLDIILLPKSRQQLRGFNALEGVLYHELGHHEQGDRYGDKSAWGGGKDSTKETNAVARELGWTWSKRLGESLLKDKDGGLWKYNDDKERWYHAGGKRPADGKRTLKNLEMADRALVKPLTKYFPYPYEQHAEALAAFRLAPGSDKEGFDRAGLARKSPRLYEITKRFDQESIDKKYHKDKDGRSLFVRDLDGSIKPNSRYLQRRIQRAEESWRSS